MEKGYLFCITEDGQVSWISYHKTASGAIKAMEEYTNIDDEECKFIIETVTFFQKLEPVQ